MDNIYRERDGDARVGKNRLEAIQADIAASTQSATTRIEAAELLNKIYQSLRTQ